MGWPPVCRVQFNSTDVEVELCAMWLPVHAMKCNLMVSKAQRLFAEKTWSWLAVLSTVLPRSIQVDSLGADSIGISTVVSARLALFLAFFIMRVYVYIVACGP